MKATKIELALFIFFVAMAIAWHILFIIEDEPLYLIVGILWFITAIMIGKE